MVTLGRLPKKWKWLLVNGYNCKGALIYGNRIFKLMQRWVNCINVLGDYLEKQ
jgi:hypothetical protein